MEDLQLERIFNLFLFMDSDGIIYELGGVAHDADGTDEEKLDRLKRWADSDCEASRRYPIPSRYLLVTDLGQPPLPRLRYETYDRMYKLGRYLEIFEEVFADQGAPREPLVCVTPVIDGVALVQGTLGRDDPAQRPEQEAAERAALRSGAAHTAAPPSGVVPLFPAGRLAMSKGAEELLRGSGLTVELLLLRHLAGDFGEAGKYAMIRLTPNERQGQTDDTGKLNKVAIDGKEGRIMSVYRLSADCTIWIITDWYTPHVVTTVLRPEDY
jgi:hypothetical protein